MRMQPYLEQDLHQLRAPAPISGWDGAQCIGLVVDGFFYDFLLAGMKAGQVTGTTVGSESVALFRSCDRLRFLRRFAGLSLLQPVAPHLQATK